MEHADLGMPLIWRNHAHTFVLRRIASVVGEKQVVVHTRRKGTDANGLREPLFHDGIGFKSVSVGT